MAGDPLDGSYPDRGDTYFTNEFVDNVLGSYRGGLEAGGKTLRRRA